MLAPLILSLLFQSSTEPLAFARGELDSVLRRANLESWMPTIRAKIDHKIGPESYVIRSDGKTVRVIGGDPNGGMYGILELAERVQLSGAKAFGRGEIKGKPFLADRGWNMFLPLPWDYEKNFVDNDPAALTDPNRWF